MDKEAHDVITTPLVQRVALLAVAGRMTLHDEEFSFALAHPVLVCRQPQAQQGEHDYKQRKQPGAVKKHTRALTQCPQFIMFSVMEQAPT